MENAGAFRLIGVECVQTLCSRSSWSCAC